jgi:hypothetical protein
MKLTSKTDLDVPAGVVYAALADHAGWEREAVRRGAEVERPADMPFSGVGAGWRVRFPFRGKMRKALIRVDKMEPDREMAFSFQGQALEGGAEVEVTVLSPRRSRLKVSLVVKPKTLAARLFLNTLKLARRRVQARLDQRLAQLAKRIQDRHAASRGA